MYKKLTLLFVFAFFLVTIIPLVSSVPPTSPFSSSTAGLQIESPTYQAITTGSSHRFHLHVINTTDLVLNDTAVCQLHLYNQTGWDIFAGVMEFEDYNGIDFAITIQGSNFSTTGLYPFVLTCNTSTQAGFYTDTLEVNDYGKVLTEGESVSFNYSMIFLMVLFVMAIIGIFSFQQPYSKLASYWVAHILFVVGTFSVWQFNNGFAVGGGALSGVFQVMFYVSTIAVFPMILMSVVWVFWMSVMNDTMKKLMDRGMDEDTAYKKARSKHKW